MQAAIFATTPAAQVSQWTTGGEPVAPPLTESRGRWKAGLPLALGAAAVIAVALWIAGGMPDDTPLEISTSNILQVTRGGGGEFHPALSPDGKDVAFTVGPIEDMSIVVRSAVEIGSGGESRLAQDEPGHQSIPSWTPDGASLRFFGFSPASGWNWKEVGKLGGSVRTINRPHAGWNRLSPDGSRVVFSRRDSIFAYAADHGEPELLGVHRVHPGVQHAFAWSPDGRRIAYVNRNTQWWYSANVEASSIWVIDAEGGEPVRVTDHDHLNMSPQWLGDSGHLLFVSDRDGPRRVYAVEVGPDGPRGPPGSVSGASDPHTISVSADGRKLAFSKFTTRQNIWSIPVPGSGQVSVRAATPITMGNQVIETHSLSPDRQWIAYDSDIRGGFDLYRMPLEGGTPQLIVDIAGTMYSPIWSPDGTEFAFYGQPHGAAHSDVFVVPAAGGAPKQLTEFPGIDGYPDWSPDGLVIAFASQGPEGLDAGTIWTVSRDSVGGRWREPVQLHDTPCGYPDWAPTVRASAMP
jgi:TolB protein